MDKIKVLLTGGSGILGTELLKIYNKNKYEFLSPSSRMMDITNLSCCEDFFKNNKFDLVIHAAAYTNTKKAEIEYDKCIQTNVIGTINILKLCMAKNIKLVYISTDYVFDGKKGNYKNTDYINPLTAYSCTKAASELLIKNYKNSLIIRTSFFGHTFPHEKAFIDQKTTKDYIDVMAPKILDLALSEKTGIEHCGSTKRTVYEIALERNKNIVSCYREESACIVPEDTSLI